MLHFYAFVGGLMLLAGPVAAQTASILPIGQSEGDHVLAPAPVSAAPTVYFAADEMPAFTGGTAAMLTFLSHKINYPAAALDHCVSDKVHVAFVVDPEGHLHDPHVVRGLGFGFDEEALRLVRIMPWWTPGRIHGQPVWVSVTLPIVF